MLNHLLDLGSNLLALTLGLAFRFALAIGFGFFRLLTTHPLGGIVLFDLATLDLVGHFTFLLLGPARLFLVRQAGLHQLFLQGAHGKSLIYQ